MDSLASILAADPSLAATPEAAATLARAAASPVPDFVGANLPVYLEISSMITAAAPPAQRDAVHQAVSRELTRFVATDVRIMPPLQPETIGNAPRQAPEVGGPGFKVGSFTVYPEVQAGLFYDNNIYDTRTGKVADKVGSISPRIALKSNWDRNALYAEAGTDLTGYLTKGSENTVDWHALVEGRIDVDRNTRVLLGASTLMEHEDRASPDAVEGLTPTPYWEQNGYAGVVHRFGDFSVRAGGAVERITFGNVEATHGSINNHDRDRNRYTFGVSVRDDAQPGFRPFVEFLEDLRRYDHSPDDFGYRRNSDGYRASIGALFRISPALSGEASVGVMARNYTDPRFKTITTPAADANIRWQAADNTAAVVFLDRSIEETTLSGSSAYIYTVTGGRVEQTLSPDLTGFVRAAFAHSEFQQSSRWDNEADMSVGVRYYLTSLFYIGADYRYTQRVSGDSTVNFSRHQAYLMLGTAF
ncbi:outer membrane beta-barrel protein [Acidocella aquatica]|uniref:outer membrane beta-barrel protein n=1 Tax=Acidocella aquatica TaxID=1922313 RepID=UPI0024E0FB64|nr:outer membrane beta-barrel protein [Acidocella aquatica]